MKINFSIKVKTKQELFHELMILNKYETFDKITYKNPFRTVIIIEGNLNIYMGVILVGVVVGYLGHSIEVIKNHI